MTLAKFVALPTLRHFEKIVIVLNHITEIALSKKQLTYTNLNIHFLIKISFSKIFSTANRKKKVFFILVNNK